MFEFKANIIKRRKVSKRTFLLGLISAGLLGYAGITFFEKGFVPLVEMLIDQIGLNDFTNWVYIGVFAILFLLILPAIRTVMKKKTIVGGKVAFDEDNLEIIKGRQHLVIPEKDLNEINFELKQLPPESKKQNGKLYGGSFLRIPTTKGTFECELDINSKKDQDKLLEMIEFLKIEHDVKVNLKEVK